MDATSFYGTPEHQSFTLGEGAKGILLLHGFPGTPSELRPLGEALAARGWRVHAPLLPGFGADIARLGETRWQAWVGAAREAWLRTQAEAERSVLLGFSMGGAVALHVAADAPPDLLVLVAPFWRVADPRARFLPLLKHVKPRLKPFEKTDFGAAGVRARFQSLAPDLDLSDLAVQRRLRHEVTLPTAAVDELRKLGAGAFRTAARVRAPSLILQGYEDPTVPPRETRHLLGRLGGPVTLRELSGDHEIIKPHAPGFGGLTRALLNHLEAVF